MTGTYLERLAARSMATGTVLCLGLDPDPASLPEGFGRDLAGLERFAALVLEAAVPFAAAVKPNLAFFEAYGSAGMAALERLRGLVPSDVPVIADAKRGDIGSTAARQATALFDVLGADAVTVNPYLGAEAVAPLLDRPDRFAYLLCRTSNHGAGEALLASLGATLGGGVAGSWSAGMNQSGPESASRPETSVSGIVSSIVHAPGRPPSFARWRSTVWPSMWRNAMPSPAGDQTGDQDASSSVTRMSSWPEPPSRMTTFVPRDVVNVAAMYRPSGEYDGWR